MTIKRVSDAKGMIAGMTPHLHDQPYRFVAGHEGDANGALFGHSFAVIREEEGTTFVCRRAEVQENEQEGQDFARITLGVNSDLEGVGLTAAVSEVLADAGIACNVIAGFHHDHLFVPWNRREEAEALLTELSEDARR